MSTGAPQDRILIDAGYRSIPKPVAIKTGQDAAGLPRGLTSTRGHLRSDSILIEDRTVAGQ